MLIRKLSVFLFCIVVLLAVGGNASGADVKEEESKTVIEFRGTDLELTFEPSPWPVWRGDAARTGRSKLKGPGASLLETASVDLFDREFIIKVVVKGQFGSHTVKKYLVVADRSASFAELRVGPGNNLIFEYGGNYPANNPRMYSYDMSSGEKWGKYYFTIHNIALDSRGRIYDTLAYASHKLRCWDRDGDEVWVVDDPSIHKPSVITIGERLYVGFSAEAKYFVGAFDLDGNELWRSAPHKKRVERLAEDSDGGVYLTGFNTAFQKLNPDGTSAWEIQPPTPGSVPNPGCEERGPICGSDGHVWVTVPYYPGNMRPPRLPWSVFNSDGTTYKEGKHGKDKIPMRACYSSDDRFYIAYKTPSLACFEDWDEEVWSIQLSENGEVLDMVMDADNMIYLIYTAWGIQSLGEACYLAVIDPSDGEILKDILIDVPEEWCNAHSDLAIGADGKLFYLNSAGYLKEFSPFQILKKPFEIRGG